MNTYKRRNTNKQAEGNQHPNFAVCMGFINIFAVHTNPLHSKNATSAGKICAIIITIAIAPIIANGIAKLSSILTFQGLQAFA